MEHYPIQETAASNPKAVLMSLRIQCIMVGVCNVVGNALLIWALSKTLQMKTMSIQFIMILSSSDLILGITSIVFSVPSTADQYQRLQLLTSITLFVMNTSSTFSMLMILLIAFDRYLHMRYLERYPTIFTKKRGYFLVIALLAFSLSSSAAIALMILEETYRIFQLVYIFVMILAIVAVLKLYHNALHTLKQNSNEVTKSIFNQNRALGKAAVRISICVIALTTPMTVLLIIDNLNAHLEMFDAKALHTFLWYSYIIFLGNGFCNCIVFISQNAPVRRVLKRVMRYNLNLVRSVRGSTLNNA